MKAVRFLMLCFSLGWLALSGGQASAADQQKPARPNIVLCMADDQGYGDVAYYGHKIIKTPVLDEMAASCLRFDHFYAAAPVCSPTRGSVLTGRHPNRFGCFSWGYTLRPQEVTIAEALKTAGYTTGHFGKWHLGPVQANSSVCPGASGFDEWFSSPNFFDNNPLMSHNGKVVHTKGESSEITMNAALAFIRGAAKSKQPFLAVVWFGSPHSPHTASDEFRELYKDQPAKLANYLGEISGIDRAVGQLRSELRKLNVADNTLLWYTSDNGAQGPGSTGGLSGKKGSLWEGGIRVPAIIEWPDRITKHAVCDMPCDTVDIYPTLLDIVGVKIPHQPPLDGISLVDAIDGKMTTRPKPLGFWVYPERGHPVRSTDILRQLEQQTANGQAPPKPADDPAAITKTYPLDNLPGHAALIDNDYKLHRIPDKSGGQVKYSLFNLKDDPQEKHDLAAAEPERTQQMKAALEAWQKSVVNSLNGKDYVHGG